MIEYKPMKDYPELMESFAVWVDPCLCTHDRHSQTFKFDIPQDEEAYAPGRCLQPDCRCDKYRPAHPFVQAVGDNKPKSNYCGHCWLLHSAHTVK